MSHIPVAESNISLNMTMRRGDLVGQIVGVNLEENPGLRTSATGAVNFRGCCGMLTIYMPSKPGWKGKMA